METAKMNQPSDWIIPAPPQECSTANKPSEQVQSTSGYAELQDQFDVSSLTRTPITIVEEKKMEEPEEKITDRIRMDRYLRWVQVGMFCLCVISGLMVALSLGWAYNVNQNNCPIYAEVALAIDVSNDTVTAQMQNTLWGPESMCYYCTYSAVCIAIYGIVWLWFYVLTCEWDAYKVNPMLPPDLKLLPVALICSSILFITALVATGTTSAGYGHWCSSITNSLISAGVSGGSCSQSSGFTWTPDSDAKSTYAYFEWAVAGSWILLLSLLIKVIVCGIRINHHLSALLMDEDDEKSEVDFVFRKLSQSDETVTLPTFNNVPKNLRKLPIIPEKEDYLPIDGVIVPEHTPDGALCSESKQEGVSFPQHEFLESDELLLGASALHPYGCQDYTSGSADGYYGDSFTKDAQITHRMKPYMHDVETLPNRDNKY